MTTLVLRPETSVQIKQALDLASKVASIIEVHPLRTPEDEAQAGQLARVVATTIAELDGARKTEKAPHLAAGRAVDDAFAAPLAGLKRVDGMLRDALAAAAQRRETAKLEAVASARAAALAGDAVKANEALASVPADAGSPGVSERWGWEAVSVDVRTVPVDFLMLDLTKVRAYVKDCVSAGRTPEIPGIVFERKAGIVLAKV